MTHPTAAQSDLVLALREEFRAHLETFYSRLKLAPPYESVEKAIRSLTTVVHGLPNAERARLAQDPGRNGISSARRSNRQDSPRNIAASLQAWRGTERVSGCPQSTTIFLTCSRQAPPDLPEETVVVLIHDGFQFVVHLSETTALQPIGEHDGHNPECEHEQPDA